MNFYIFEGIIYNSILSIPNLKIAIISSAIMCIIYKLFIANSSTAITCTYNISYLLQIQVLQIQTEHSYIQVVYKYIFILYLL